MSIEYNTSGVGFGPITIDYSPAGDEVTLVIVNHDKDASWNDISVELLNPHRNYDKYQIQKGTDQKRQTFPMGAISGRDVKIVRWRPGFLSVPGIPGHFVFTCPASGSLTITIQLQVC